MYFYIIKQRNDKHIIKRLKLTTMANLMENPIVMYFEEQDERGDWEVLGSYEGINKKILKLWIAAAKRKQVQGGYSHIVVRSNNDPEFQAFFYQDGDIKVLFNDLKIKI